MGIYLIPFSGVHSEHTSLICIPCLGHMFSQDCHLSYDQSLQEAQEYPIQNRIQWILSEALGKEAP
jgi:hypothetical protein